MTNVKLSRICLASLIGISLLALPALAQAPYAQPDDSWVSLSGTVVDPGAETFLLDYGEGTITVEMDDWDWYGEAYQLLEGDEVTVYGEIDDDFYEIAKIEASSVYVDSLNSYYYANDADEEELISTFAAPIAVDTDVVFRGTVTKVNGREFTLDTGTQELTVDTIFMDYNPLDKKGFQQVTKGDRVSVAGDMDYDVVEKRELMADSVITLSQGEKKTESTS